MPQPALNFTQADVKVINDLSGMLSFTPTQQSRWLMNSDAKIIFLCSGNRGGKTHGVAMMIVSCILGLHPIRKMNILPTDEVRIIRLASETLPGTDGDGEVRNSIYPAIKRLLPPYLLKKDITARRPAMTVKSPLGGKDVILEFCSYSQSTQAMAGVDRRMIWCDEAPSQEFWEESIPRLMISGGPLVLSYTPVAGGGAWVFDNIYENASRIYRTEAVRAYTKETTGLEVPECEVKGAGFADVDVIISSSYDNPIISKEEVDATFQHLGPAERAARCYGLFRELSGSVYEKFRPAVHVVNQSFFPVTGPPAEWRHFRAVDWHTREPIAVVWASLSPEDELFIWQEANPSPTTMVTPQIAEMIASKSGDLKYTATLIDPLASATQTNTGMTTVEDLNRLFRQFKRDGLCSGGYWEPWDTKGEVGREKLRERLYNSITCGKPFNNKSVRNGQTINLPTVWVSSACPNVGESLKNWRYEAWASRDSELEKGEKPKPIGRWSHFCTAIEALLKDNRVSRAHFGAFNVKPSGKMYYSGGR